MIRSRISKTLLSIFFVPWLLLIPGISTASNSDLEVSIEIDKSTVSVDDYLTLEVTISGGDSGSVENPEISGIENFEVLGIATGTQISIINMSMHKSKTFTYTLQPKKAGEKSKISATAEYDGTKATSNRIEVTTVQPSQNPRPRRGFRQPNLFGDFFGKRDPFGTFGSRNVKKDDFILQSNLNTSEVYVGQEVIYNLSFYRAYNIWSNAQYNFPDANGFWVELLPDDQKMTTRNETMAGRNYLINEMATLLYPLTDGEKIIEPGTIKFQPNAFSPPLQLESNQVKLKVKPLPEKGKPKDFSGLVGDFEILLSSDKITAPDYVEAGKPVTIDVTVSGSGNIQSIQKPSFPRNENGEMYEPEVIENFKRTSLGSSGSKRFKFIFVPEKEGPITIGPFKTNYFDPKTGAYEYLSSEPVTFDVKAGGSHGKSAVQAPLSGHDNAAGMSAVLRYIKPDMEKLHSHKREYYRNPFFWLYPLTLATLLAFFGGRIKSGKPLLFRDKWESLTPRQKLSKRMEPAGLYAENGDSERFYETISVALKKYLSEKLDMPVYELSEGNLKNSLPECEANISHLYRILNECDNARFSPGERKNGDMKKILVETEEIANLLDKSLK
ncbi:MAG: BatD family protein [Nitrospinota bacterium]|nr:BatD family protein [Nitrospinota bacterium]